MLRWTTRGRRITTFAARYFSTARPSSNVARYTGLGVALVSAGLGATWGRAQLEAKKPAVKKFTVDEYREFAENQFEKNLDGDEENEQFQAGEEVAGLPMMTRAEIAKHNNPDDGMYVTYRNGVFDVTDFVDNHPGGAKILLAVGKDVAPFWFLFQQHMVTRTYRFLETMRIGNVHPKDRKQDSEMDANDPYSTDPRGLPEGRHPAMIVNSTKPYNAEPPPELLLENYITPTELHYIRNHMPVPVVNVKDYRLTITTPKGDKVFTLDELKTTFPKVEVMSTLQCAGNRVRGAHFVDKKKLIVGTFFDTAMGNSVWGGARLRDVLMHCGLESNGGDMNFIQFEALDKDESDVPFGGCIPIHKAMDPTGDVLLAYEMNGKPLPRDHGFPVRLICPGFLGVRNVKWVEKVIASKDETPIYWYQNDRVHLGTCIEEGPVQSLIIEPRFNTKLDPFDSTLTVKGYAWSGGGRSVICVDVSLDGGKTWKEAKLKQSGQKKWRSWAWTHWECDFELPEDYAGIVEICCKASDASFNTQPQKYKEKWVNAGCINNRWHRQRVNRPAKDE